MQLGDYSQSIGFKYLETKKNSMREFDLFYVTSLRLIINLGEPLFPQKGINLIRSP
jgi:hypothetical protein